MHIVDTMIYFKFTVLIIIEFQIDILNIMCIDFVKVPSLMMTTPLYQIRACAEVLPGWDHAFHITLDSDLKILPQYHFVV